MKPGDKVLVEGFRSTYQGGDCVRVACSAEDSQIVTPLVVCPHPGIDPALIGELVAAVRREAEAWTRLRSIADAESVDHEAFAEAATAHMLARKALHDLAARMEADERAKLAAEIGAACCGGFTEADDE